MEAVGESRAESDEEEEDEEEESEEEEEGEENSEDPEAETGPRTVDDLGEGTSGTQNLPQQISAPVVTTSKNPVTETETDPALSPVSTSRPISRSPPASRHESRSSSPTSLIDATASLSIVERENENNFKDRVASEVSKQYSKQQRKYHSKRGAQRIGGRQKGSKAKMDTRVKLDRGGIWD
ncbi:hypothetical protein C8Q75DRAFT_239510 [Abortiporus biennis]|nr:hypothetical protein C8Q75DRAFT_239510 [Abortiporus biennis]